MNKKGLWVNPWRDILAKVGIQESVGKARSSHFRCSGQGKSSPGAGFSVGFAINREHPVENALGRQVGRQAGPRLELRRSLEEARYRWRGDLIVYGV